MSSLPEKIKSILERRMTNARLRVGSPDEEAIAQILAAFREYVESKKPHPLMGKRAKKEQEWIDAALGIYEEDLLSGLSEEKE